MTGIFSIYPLWIKETLSGASSHGNKRRDAPATRLANECIQTRLKYTRFYQRPLFFLVKCRPDCSTSLFKSRLYILPDAGIGCIIYRRYRDVQSLQALFNFASIISPAFIYHIKVRFCLHPKEVSSPRDVYRRRYALSFAVRIFPLETAFTSD